jgi:hypothetical protein
MGQTLDLGRIARPGQLVRIDMPVVDGNPQRYVTICDFGVSAVVGAAYHVRFSQVTAIILGERLSVEGVRPINLDAPVCLASPNDIWTLFMSANGHWRGVRSLGESRERGDVFCNLAPATLARWNAGLGRVKAGVGRATLLLCGASSAVGVGPGGSDGRTRGYAGGWSKSYFAHLASELARRGVPVSDNNWYGSGGFVDRLGGAMSAWRSWDARMGDPGEQWSSHGREEQSEQLGGYPCAWRCADDPQTLTFAPGASFDTVTTFFVRGPGLGAFQVQTDAELEIASPVIETASEGDTRISVYEHRLDGLAKACRLTPVANSGNLQIQGQIFRRIDTPAVDVIKAAFYDSSTAQWAGAGVCLPDTNTPAGLLALKPDMTVLMAFLNDLAEASPAALAAAEINLEKFIVTAKTSGDVMLFAQFTGSSGVAPLFSNGFYAAWMAMVYSLCLEHDCAFIDASKLFANWSTLNRDGYAYDYGHMREVPVHTTIGQTLARALSME